MLRGIPINIMVGSDWFLQLIAHYHPGTLRGRTTSKQHHPCPSIRIRCLKQANSNTQCNTGATQSTFIVSDRPRIPREAFENSSELELDLGYWKEEPRCTERLRREWLSWSGCSTILRAQTKHVLYLFGLVLFSAAENIGFGAFCIAKFMHLGLNACWLTCNPVTLREIHTIVP